MSKEIKHISGAAGGYLVGNSHDNGGIQAINKAIGKPLEMEGGEVVITKPAVEDTELREFEGKMLTNRQILSKINESGGGVSFAEKGAELPTKIEFCGTEYKYGGETLTDYEIAHRISKCGCSHEEDSYANGGEVENIIKIVKYEENLPSYYKLSGLPSKRTIIGVQFPIEIVNQDKFKINEKNYFLNTEALFKDVTNEIQSKFKPNFISDSGSEYMYADGGVYRKSDHWGWGVASCDWELDSGNYGMQHLYGRDFTAQAKYIQEKREKGDKIGFAKWEDFKLKSIGLPLSYDEIVKGNPIPLHVFKFEYFPIIPTKFMTKELLELMRSTRTFEEQEFEILDQEHQKFVSENSHEIEWNKEPYLVKKYRINQPDLPLSGERKNLSLGFEIAKRGTKYVVTNIDEKEVEISQYSILKHEFEKGGNLEKDLKDNAVNVAVNATETLPLMERGGETAITFSTIVDNWNDVPSEWKNTTKVKKVTFINSPYDKGLISIVKPFLGEDELRLILQGINFDKKGITATNAHTLIHLPYPNPEFMGTYNPDIGKIKKQETIFGNYPNYEAVLPIPENCEHYKISIYKLLQYAKVAENYANKITHQAVFKVNDQYFGLNCSFLIDCLQALLKLGIEETYFFFQSVGRASMFCTKLDYNVGKDILVLMMPTIVQDFKYGAFDVDYNRELLCYYDFSTNEIYNENGSVAEFKMSYENNSFFDTQETKLLKSVIGRNNVLPILNYFVVENNVARVTDLETDLVIKNIDSKDGIYQITDNVPEITMYDIEEYPQPRSETNADAIEFTINSEAFEYYLDKIKLGLGKDQFRPAMEGIVFHFKENKLFLVTTDHHILFRVNLTKFIPSENLQDIERKIIVKPSILFNLLDEIENETLKITIDAVNFKLESSKFILTTKNIDAKAPNYEGILAPYFNVKKEINLSSLRTCLNSEKVIDILKNNKKETVAIYNDNNDLYAGIYNIYKNRTIENSIQICNIEIVKKEVSFQLLDQDIVVIMPLQPTTLILNSDVAYSEAILKKVIDVVNSEEIELYSDSNSNVKSNVVLMTSFDFDKTISSPKETEIDFIDLQNNFKIKVEKVYYTDKSSTYGASLFYNDTLFKYFGIIPNTTKESAVSNVYEYLKTLEIKYNKIHENAPNKGKFTVYYYDRSGEHRFISDSKKSVEDFIENVNNLKKPTSSTSENEQLQDTIDGLEILLETAKGKNKANIIDTIEGLKLLLETPKFAKGGETQVLLAPNGKPSNLNATQWHLVRTPEFKKWFGDWENSPNTSSKVVDENGEPLVVYHSTSYDYNEFKASSLAYYFAKDKKYAEFLINNVKQRYIFSTKPFFLNVRKIKKFKTEIETNEIAFYLNSRQYLKELPNGIVGKDGVPEDFTEEYKNIDNTTYVVFYQNQMKLADGTNTTFDENTNDIRYEKGGTIDKKEELVFTPIATPIN